MRGISDFSFGKWWFLDCFGHLLCYTPHWKRLKRVPLQGQLVSGFISGPYPFPKQYVPQWCNIFGAIVPLDPLELQRLGDRVVALYSPVQCGYLTINPRNNETAFSSQLQEWETFCLLSEDALTGLLILSDATLGKLTLDETDEELEPLYFPLPSENKIFVAALGRRRIKVCENLDRFSEIGRLAVGQSMSIILKGYMPGKEYNITVKRLRKLAL